MNDFELNQVATVSSCLPIGSVAPNPRYPSPLQVHSELHAENRNVLDFPANDGQNGLGIAMNWPADPNYLLKQELEECNRYIKRLNMYWAAVADDLGSEQWRDPANVYRRIWEQEIGSASDRHEYLLNRIRSTFLFENQKQNPMPAVSYDSHEIREIQGSIEDHNASNMRLKTWQADPEYAQACQVQTGTCQNNGAEALVFPLVPQNSLEHQISCNGTESIAQSRKNGESARHDHACRDGCTDDKENQQPGLRFSASCATSPGIHRGFTYVNHEPHEQGLGLVPEIHNDYASGSTTPRFGHSCSPDIDAECGLRKVKSEDEIFGRPREISFDSGRMSCSSGQASNKESSLSTFALEGNAWPATCDSLMTSSAQEGKAFQFISPTQSSVIDNHGCKMLDDQQTVLSKHQLIESPTYESDLYCDKLVDSEFPSRARPMMSGAITRSIAPAQTTDNQSQLDTRSNHLRHSHGHGKEKSAAYLSSPRVINASPGPQSTTLHIGNVPGINANDLYNLFEGYDIASISIPRDSHGKSSPSHGFVTLRQAAAVQYAVNKLSGQEIRGHRITIRVGNR